jgi:hypothetical protein
LEGCCFCGVAPRPKFQSKILEMGLTVCAGKNSDDFSGMVAYTRGWDPTERVM